MSCAICGGELRPWLRMPIDAKKDSVTPFSEALKCGTCDTGTLTPQPRGEQIPELYELDSYYTQGQSHIRPVSPNLFDKILVKLAWWADKPVPFQPADMAAKLPAGGRVVDLGCGDAKLLDRFAEHGFEVIGVDPDPIAAQQAKTRGITVLAGTAEDIPKELAAQTFDLVTMTHSLEHTLSPSVALKNAASLLKEGGHVYVEVPNADCVHFREMTICSETFDSPRHLWFFTPRGLTDAVERAGLKVVGHRYHGFTRHHSRSWREWERTIFRQLKRRGKHHGAKDHTFLRSFWILARSYWAPPGRKYDCVGVLAVKP